jgi:hypothetical protein
MVVETLPESMLGNGDVDRPGDPWSTLATLTDRRAPAAMAVDQDAVYIAINSSTADSTAFYRIARKTGVVHALPVGSFPIPASFTSMSKDKTDLYVAAKDPVRSWGIAKVPMAGEVAVDGPDKPIPFFLSPAYAPGSDGNAGGIRVVHTDADSVYYTHLSVTGPEGTGKLMRMCKDGSNAVALAEGYIQDFAVDEANVYYVLRGDLYALSK